jgi:F-type H+-transporting ATPase subunit b
VEHVDLVKGVLLPYINFFLFVGMAVWFFKKPLSKALSAQRESYYQTLKDANAALTSAQQKHDEINEQLQKFHHSLDELQGKVGDKGAAGQLTMDGIKERARKQAEAQREALLQKTQKLARQLEEEASRIAEYEIERAREQLKKEILDITKQKVVERLKTELGESKQLQLVKNKAGVLEQLNLEV